jgi:polyferredoxin
VKKFLKHLILPMIIFLTWIFFIWWYSINLGILSHGALFFFIIMVFWIMLIGSIFREFHKKDGE